MKYLCSIGYCVFDLPFTEDYEANFITCEDCPYSQEADTDYIKYLEDKNEKRN